MGYSLEMFNLADNMFNYKNEIEAQELSRPKSIGILTVIKYISGLIWGDSNP